ncbi:hypothetical protein chiPu_0018386 [Chiloscyllium punctatum]|uniref:Fibrinogen C-terminal domain-containing protein n=1 Tax=Chiloscyllium punctatum TaxID=137246 RepID=A0A401RMQ2_CHIPU|nr:hypothetical protein [Chiloscyllium punctatum]
MLVDWIQSQSSFEPRDPQSGDQFKPTQCPEKKWQICTYGDWGSKCPSGCRMQGLIKTENQQNDNRIQELQRMLDMYSTAFRNTYITVTEAVNRIRQTLSSMGGLGDTYYQLVDYLNSRLTILQNKTKDQNLRLKRLKNNILEQFKVVLRLEVDIDIKTQSCKGSCATAVVYEVNKESNAQMEKLLQSMTGIKLDRIVDVKPIHKLKMNLMKKSKKGTSFKFDIDHEYPRFWEDVHTSFKVRKIEDYIGKDCNDIIQKHAFGDEDGLFKIKPTGSAGVVTVYCDQSTGLGGWVLVQQRMDGSVHFNRSWAEYKQGFGSIDDQGHGDIWLGNEVLHLLTQKESIFRVELEDWSGNEVFAEYTVTVGSESDSYRLNIADYGGNAGDALISGISLDSEHTSHASMKFSTYDRDNDKWEENCAEFYGGGWWYNSCQSANLNGIYYNGGLYDPRNNMPYEIENGVVWVPFKGGDYSLKVVRVKTRSKASS